MFRKKFQKYSLYIAIVTLAILTIITYVGCIFLGVETGLIVGAIAFVVLDGLGSLWEVLTYRTDRDIRKYLDKKEIKTLNEKSGNNPTIR